MNKKIKTTLLLTGIASYMLFVNLAVWSANATALKHRMDDPDTSAKNYKKAEHQLKDVKTYYGFAKAAHDYNKIQNMTNQIRNETFKETGNYKR